MERVKGGEKMNSNEGVVFAGADEGVVRTSLGSVWRTAGGENVYDNAVVSKCAWLESSWGDGSEGTGGGASGVGAGFMGLLLVGTAGERALFSGSVSLIGEAEVEGSSVMRSGLWAWQES